MTSFSGIVTGFVIQQNKGTLDQIPNGQAVAAVLANAILLTVKDLSFIATTGRQPGSQLNVQSDLEYFSAFNIGGVVGYLAGNAKDYLEKHVF